MVSSGIIIGFMISAIGGLGYFFTNYKKISLAIIVAGFAMIVLTFGILFLVVNSNM